ncbi:MAG: hypothetical protein L0Y75_03065 [Acidobacteria bacterium]|nr:hypothetical protein [Acidobacteriota bacterium]
MKPTGQDSKSNHSAFTPGNFHAGKIRRRWKINGQWLTMGAAIRGAKNNEQKYNRHRLDFDFPRLVFLRLGADQSAGCE